MAKRPSREEREESISTNGIKR